MGKLSDLIIGWLQTVRQLLGKGAFETTIQLDLDGARHPLNDDEPLAEACRRVLVADYDRFGTSPARSASMLLFPWDKSQQRSDGSLCPHESTVEAYTDLLVRRRLAVTSKGWVGKTHEEAEVGDHVAVSIGASVPFILRKPQEDMARRHDNEYILIGDAYVHGLVHGKGLDLAEVGEIVLR